MSCGVMNQFMEGWLSVVSTVYGSLITSMLVSFIFARNKISHMTFVSIFTLVAVTRK
jgi:hypothetical protein